MNKSKYFLVVLSLTFIGFNNIMLSQNNPFFEEWNTTFQTPPFSK